MKMVVAFIQDYDCDRLLRGITAAGLSATKVSSMGGFLRTRNVTVLIGLEAERVPECLRIIEQACKSRVEVQLDPAAPDYADWYAAGIHEVTIGGAIVFVLRVSRFERLFAPLEVANAHAGSGPASGEDD